MISLRIYERNFDQLRPNRKCLNRRDKEMKDWRSPYIVRYSQSQGKMEMLFSWEPRYVLYERDSYSVNALQEYRQVENW